MLKNIHVCGTRAWAPGPGPGEGPGPGQRPKGAMKYGPGGKVVPADSPPKKARFGSEEEKQRYYVARRLFPKVKTRELMRLVKKSFGLPESALGHEAALKAARGN